MNSHLDPASRNSGRSRTALLAGNATIRVILVLVITAIVALATVVNMMQGDYTNLLIGLAVGGVAAYVGGLWNYSWFGAILIGLMGFSLAPTSFLIPAEFICCGLALGMGATLLMRRALGASSPPDVITPGLNTRAMVVLLILYFLYLLIQGMFGEVMPVYSDQYSIRNTAKGYAEDMLPILTLVTLVICRYRLPSMEVMAKYVTPAMIVALLYLCAYRAYQVFQGVFEVEEGTGVLGPLVPVINLIPGEFALRVASPTAAIWGASRLFSPNERLTKPALCSNVFLIVLALAGSLLSAGRAVPAITLFGICAMAFLLRRFGFLFMATGGFVLFVCLVNVAAPAIDQMSYSVRRSVAMLRFDQNADKDAIAGSSTMRQFLIDEGMKEIRSSTRIFLTGRGVLQFTAGDATINQSSQEYDKWMLAVRTGRLHRTTASHLIRYGAVGVLLYYLGQIAALLYTYKVYRYFRGRRMPEVTLAAFVFTILVMNTINGLIQDGPFTNLTAWFIALLVGVVTKHGVPVGVRSDAPVNAPGREVQFSGGLASRRG